MLITKREKVKSKVSVNYSEENSVFREVSYLFNFNFNLIFTQVDGVGVGTHLSLIGREKGWGGC